MKGAALKSALVSSVDIQLGLSAHIIFDLSGILSIPLLQAVSVSNIENMEIIFIIGKFIILTRHCHYRIKKANIEMLAKGLEGNLN